MGLIQGDVVPDSVRYVGRNSVPKRCSCSEDSFFTVNSKQGIQGSMKACFLQQANQTVVGGKHARASKPEHQNLLVLNIRQEYTHKD